MAKTPDASTMHATSATRRRHRLDSVEGYLLLGMPQQALREVDAVRAGGHDDASVCRLRGEVLRDLRRHDEALEEYEHADEQQPDDLTTLMGMAWCLKRIDRLQDALDTMQRAYHAHPDEPIVLYNVACYLSLAGEKSQALSWLGRALRMAPKLRRLIADETDFDPLRSDPDFQFIVADPGETAEGP